MSNEQQNAREAAIERFRTKYPLTMNHSPSASQILDGFKEGFDAGAASVDRVEIVREAFEEVKRRCEHGNYAFVMDAVIEAMEKGK